MHVRCEILIAARMGGVRLIDVLTPGTDERLVVGVGSDPYSAWIRRGASVLRTVVKSKIHRATVTGADLDYEGSCSIDPEAHAAGRHPSR